jgi:hypothetical protein
MNNFLRLSIFLSMLTLISGCAGMITTATPYSGYGGYSYEPPKTESNRIFFPLSFSIKTLENESLEEKMSELSNDRIREFVSIGIASISTAYGLDLSEWETTIEVDSDPEPEQDDIASLLLGYDVEPEYIDYKLLVKFDSSFSRSFDIDNSNKNQSSLIKIDKALSSKKSYRVTFDGTAKITLRQLDPESVYFDLNLYARVERKSKFSDEKHFSTFKRLDEREVGKLREAINTILLESYYSSLKSLGFNIEKG